MKSIVTFLTFQFIIQSLVNKVLGYNTTLTPIQAYSSKYLSGNITEKKNTILTRFQYTYIGTTTPKN